MCSPATSTRAALPRGGSSSGGSSTGGGSGTAGTVVATGVTTTSVNLRASASTESASLAVIPGNTTVGIIAQSGNFYKVSYNGAVGYVQKTYLGNIKQSTGGSSSSTQTELEKGRVTASSLNVRASASSSGTLLDRLEYGTIVEIVAKRGDFYQIKYGGGAGYVSAGYVEIVSDGSIKETTASVNFRSGPGTSYESLGTLRPARWWRCLQKAAAGRRCVTAARPATFLPATSNDPLVPPKTRTAPGNCPGGLCLAGFGLLNHCRRFSPWCCGRSARAARCCGPSARGWSRAKDRFVDEAKEDGREHDGDQAKKEAGREHDVKAHEDAEHRQEDIRRLDDHRQPVGVEVEKIVELGGKARVKAPFVPGKKSATRAMAAASAKTKKTIVTAPPISKP